MSIYLISSALLQKKGLTAAFEELLPHFIYGGYIKVNDAYRIYILLQYAYAPDYLQNEKDRRYITDPTAVLLDLNTPTVKTNLIIDDGNIIKCPDKVIMTEKVFCENKNIPRNKVIAMREQLCISWNIKQHAEILRTEIQ